MNIVKTEVNFSSAKELSDYRKAMVRPYVTYSILGFYGISTLVLGGVVLKTNTDLNNGLLTIYTGLSTLTASIVSFWFGGRGASSSRSQPEDDSNQDKINDSGNDNGPSSPVPTPEKLETKDVDVDSENDEDQTSKKLPTTT